jgi:dolichyl-phosphate-mannose--protein O-mannosyl transferase
MLAKKGNVPSVKSVLRTESPLAFGAVLFVAVVTLVVGVWGRVWSLGFPPKKMWDEIYFPVMANKYLNGVEFFDLHPPLGKFIIASSIWLFGNTPLAWRLTPAIFGIGLIALAGAVGWYLFKERVAVPLLVVLFAGETILIVHSRTGVMDIFLVFFVMATFLVALWARGPRHALLAAVLLGLAISVKWAAFPVAIPAGYVLWRKGLLKPFAASLWVSVVIYFALVYVERLIIITPNPVEAWVDVWGWHLEAADKINAAIPHLWGSPWWSWPIMLRPIRYEYLIDPDGGFRVLLAIGNPLVWWSSTLAVLAGLFELARRAIVRTLDLDDPLVPIILGYVVLLLPWVPGTRIPYIYNYLPMYAFALLALTYWLVRIWRAPRVGPWIVAVFAALALAVTLYYLPLASTLTIEQDDLMRRILFDSWFYQQSPVPGSGCTPPNPDERCF